MIFRGSAPLRAVITGVFGRKNNRYAVAVADTFNDGSITFSLLPGEGVWAEERVPHRGNEVLLEDLTRTERGWRANKARFVRPGDESIG